MASRTMASCVRRAAAMSVGASSHTRVESSISVNKNVNVPLGSPRDMAEPYCTRRLGSSVRWLALRSILLLGFEDGLELGEVLLVGPTYGRDHQWRYQLGEASGGTTVPARHPRRARPRRRPRGGRLHG